MGSSLREAQRGEGAHGGAPVPEEDSQGTVRAKAKGREKEKSVPGRGTHTGRGPWGLRGQVVVNGMEVCGAARGRPWPPRLRIFRPERSRHAARFGASPTSLLA